MTRLHASRCTYEQDRHTTVPTTPTKSVRVFLGVAPREVWHPAILFVRFSLWVWCVSFCAERPVAGCHTSLSQKDLSLSERPLSLRKTRTESHAPHPQREPTKTRTHTNLHILTRHRHSRKHPHPYKHRQTDRQTRTRARTHMKKWRFRV